MIRFDATIGILACAAIAVSAKAQTLAPEYAGVYTLQDLGAVSGLPPSYGGMAFQRGNPNILLMGGFANGGSGRIHSIPVNRAPNGHITGFGAATDYCAGGWNDGGLDFAPNGTLLVAQYPLNSVGQVLPGNLAAFAVETPMNPSGVFSSVGGLLFVPEGQPGEGRLKMTSFNFSRWYDVPFTPQPNGTYTFGTITTEVQLVGGLEAFVYVPGCSQAFPNPSILVCEWQNGIIAAYDVNMQGDPLPTTRRIFISGLSGAEGAVIDPISGDYLFGTFGGGNRVIRVEGFPPPLSCPCDWNNVNCVNSQDFFDFISDFFAGNADFNEDNITNSQDFFDFLSCFFSGCD